MAMELIGREREYTILADCLDAAVGGRPQLVVCRGEAGIGKTRLADELLTAASARGALCARGLAADFDRRT